MGDTFRSVFVCLLLFKNKHYLAGYGLLRTVELVLCDLLSSACLRLLKCVVVVFFNN